MNKPVILGALAALTALSCMGKAPKDPVLMTVGGKDVTLSEFEYLYHKNNSQQLQPQTLDEYVDMFVTYKLKVAAAEAAGIDTTAAFLNEFSGYRDELAKPYLTDEEYVDSLARVAYDRYLTSVGVSHIMVPLTDAQGNAEPQLQLADSLRSLVLGGADMSRLARLYSIDKSAAHNGGDLGQILSGQYPYEFEDVAFRTPEGEVSEVFDTRFGHHFIKAGARKANPGEVHVRHILRLTRGVPAEQADAQKATIDSIYALLKSGADFAATATALSQDPGSARNGGELPWFGVGRMVPEFEQTAFALADGEMSEPFKSDFGWHIVLREGHRAPMTYEEMKPQILKAFERDMRQQMINSHNIAVFEKEFPVTIVNSDEHTQAMQLLSTNGLDSVSRAALASMNWTPAKAGKAGITSAEVIAAMGTADIPAAKAVEAYNAAVRRLAEEKVMDQARDNLVNTSPAYRNLLSEYRDGMLLFEVSNREVWDRAAKDEQGLEQYFRDNRGNYTWTKPHFKGYVVLCTNDSVAALAREFAASRTWENNDSLNAALRGRFGRDARSERVVTAKGDNEIVDYVAFGGTKPAPKEGRRMNEWFAVQGRVIDAPEESSDVKGAVSTDYQQYLEEQWVKGLRRSYPVKINKKVLKKVK